LGFGGKRMETTFHGRRARRLTNGLIRVTVLAGGGHIAEIALVEGGLNPLWIPPWPSIEPSQFDPRVHNAYGDDVESRLLAGIMGHNLCLDLFGAPSAEEAAAGLTVHGEAPVVDWDLREAGGLALAATAELPRAGLRVERRLSLQPDSRELAITETIENLTAIDRPVGWTQHVTLGPPFVAPGRTTIDLPGTRSKVYESDFTGGKGPMKVGAEFDWPFCPANDGGLIDLRRTSHAPVSAGYTAHLLDPSQQQAWFTASNPDLDLTLGYRWQREDFPWLGIWEENHCRERAPWNGRAVTRGLEFGVSPMPETRRQMIDRGSLFGVPGYRWIPARSRVMVEYSAFLARASGPPPIA